MIALFVLLFVAAGSVTSTDSEGTQFFWTFLRNADPDSDLPNQNLTVTVINGANNVPCDFVLRYKADYYKNTPYTTKTITVQPNSAGEMSIPAYYGFAFDTPESPQYQNSPDVTLTANSTCPVTLLANNYDSLTGQGDSFVVLPVGWSSNYFSFSLPPAYPDQNQYHVVTFIPTQRDANIKLRIVEHGDTLKFPARFQSGETVYIAVTTGSDNLPRTYRVESDAPIQIVAGVTCAGVYPAGCDHAAFMPHPLPSNACADYEWVDDDHASDTVSAANFFIDIPNNCYSKQTVNATSAKNGQQTLTKEISLDPNQQSQLQTFDIGYFGRAVSFHAGGSATHVTRVFDSSPTGKPGAYLTTVPALTSFINTTSYFYTKNEDDSLEIICQTLICTSMQIDGVKMMTTNSSYDSINIDDVLFWSFTAPVKGQGMHFITFSGTLANHVYTYYVIGKTKNYSYGYIGHAMIPSLVVVGSTPSTSTVTTPTTTVTSPPTTSTVASLTSSTTPSVSSSTVTSTFGSTTSGSTIGSTTSGSTTVGATTTGSSSVGTTSSGSTSTASTVVSTSTVSSSSTIGMTTSTLSPSTVSSTVSPSTATSPPLSSSTSSPSTSPTTSSSAMVTSTSILSSSSTATSASTPSPSTASPSTLSSSTGSPSTTSPSTPSPSTASPSTLASSTGSPSTISPSTPSPSTASPSTLASSTGSSSTQTPSTTVTVTSTAKPTTTVTTVETSTVSTMGTTESQTAGSSSTVTIATPSTASTFTIITSTAQQTSFQSSSITPPVNGESTSTQPPSPPTDSSTSEASPTSTTPLPTTTTTTQAPNTPPKTTTKTTPPPVTTTTTTVTTTTAKKSAMTAVALTPVVFVLSLLM